MQTPIITCHVPIIQCENFVVSPKLIPPICDHYRPMPAQFRICYQESRYWRNFRYFFTQAGDTDNICRIFKRSLLLLRVFTDRQKGNVVQGMCHSVCQGGVSSVAGPFFGGRVPLVPCPFWEVDKISRGGRVYPPLRTTPRKDYPSPQSGGYFAGRCCASCWNVFLLVWAILWNFKSDSALKFCNQNKRVLIKVYICVDQLNSIQKMLDKKIFQVVYLVSAENLFTILA